jgi:hypothetical protein
VLDAQDFSSSALRDVIRVVSAPRHLNQNLRAQRGIFTHLPHANATYMETGAWPSLEDALTGASAGHKLALLTLPATEADALLRLLLRYNVTRHHLMPTLDNAAAAFKYFRALL